MIVDEEGTVLTNAHVVDGAVRVRYRWAERKSLTAEVVESDRSTDLAVLELGESPIRP